MAFFTIMLFAVGASFAIAFIISDNINTAFQGIPDLPSEGKTSMNNFNNRFPTVMDYSFLTIVAGTLAGMLVLVWFLPVNPIVFFISMMVVALLAAVGGYLANAWIGMAADTVLGASISNFPVIDYVLSHYLVVILIFGFLTIIVFFAKPGGVQ